MGEENPLIYLLGGGSLSLLVAAFIKGAWDYFQGRHDREREAAKDRRDTIGTLKDDLRDAEARADQARMESLLHQRKAGTYWEYASRLRQYAISTYQADPDSLPRWPSTD